MSPSLQASIDLNPGFHKRVRIACSVYQKSEVALAIIAFASSQNWFDVLLRMSAEAKEPKTPEDDGWIAHQAIIDASHRQAELAMQFLHWTAGIELGTDEGDIPRIRDLTQSEKQVKESVLTCLMTYFVA